MKTLLLLAGRSTRFWPLSDKSLFPICGKTLLEYQIERLQKAGCTDITVVGGAHNLDQIRSLLPGLNVVEQEDLDLGMHGALLSALPSCGSDPVLIVSGNDVIEPDAFTQVISAATNVDGGALLAQKVSSYFPGGYLTVEGEHVTGIVEKPGEGNEPSDLVNIVAHAHNNAYALLDALQDVDESNDDGYEQAVQKLLDQSTYHTVPYTGTWQAVKYPWHMLELLEILLEEMHEPIVHATAEVHATAILDGPVVIAENVKVLPHAVIRGPCFIGPNSIVANNALVRNSSIGEGCVIGYNTEIKNSVLHSHVWTHMAYIGDSIIGHNVAFGGGTVTGNFRLDERTISSSIKGESLDTGRTKFGNIIGDNVRIGIQVGLNPGVKIGKNSFIAGGTYVHEDIDEQNFVCMKDGILVKKVNRENPQDSSAREQYRAKVEQ